jgi:hypothetical protein
VETVKIYISSTYRDLREYRNAVDAALRRMGHDVIGMEQYVAEGTTPLDKCLQDVRSSDAYIVIVGWRYGFRPEDATLNPCSRSITELEYLEAVQQGKSILAFLLDPETPWPPNSIDALDASGGADVVRFRADIGSAHLSGIFRTPDNLASQAAAAVSNLRLNRQMAERALEQAIVTPDMEPFVRGDEIEDSTLAGIKSMIESAGSARFLVIGLQSSYAWWSTRLYLLAALLQSLTAIRQLVFARRDGSFTAMASPAAVRQGVCDQFAEVAEFDARIRSGATADVEREVARVTSEWNNAMRARERQLKVGVRPELLEEWMGERLVKRCVNVSPEDGLTMINIQQIVESLLPDVPIDWPQPEPQQTSKSPGRKGRLMVVDRDSYALEVARQWVRASLPRTPVR